MKSEREKFQAWFIGEYGHDMFVESDWKAWQAAKAEAQNKECAWCGCTEISGFKSQEKENGC